MKAKELRKKYLNYFQKKDHQIISSASLIPDNDPTVLFTTAGMHPLVPYLMGEKHPAGKRLVNIQKCLRTNDIDEVGDKTHHTFFEMLGNWSLGDYFKKETIQYSWEFLIKELKIDKSKLAVSIFGGNNDIKDYDQESEQYWLDLGLEASRITRVSDNWWGPAGLTGPCGPDTEIFYWTGQDKVPDKFDEADTRWVEIWNNVIMEYNKVGEGKYETLKQKNIDTGMGLERTLAVLNNVDDNYLTELFLPIIKELEKLANKKYTDDVKSFRIIADHLRSSVFLLADGITPSNKDQGYVLRRLIRRAIVFSKKLNINGIFTRCIAEVIIKNYAEDYSELKKNKLFILDEIEKEEINFQKTIENGMREFNKWYNLTLTQEAMPGVIAFKLFATYGFPIELTVEIAKEKHIEVDLKDFEKELNKHQELSRTASAGMFKGGLADDNEMTKKHHTAAHLMLQALRTVLGNTVEQRGSNINESRIRFDFLYDNKLSDQEIKKVEDLVNEQIKAKLKINCEEMSVAEAKKAGAVGIFDQKYGAKVKVYTIGDFSKEICGGPHVNNTAELGHFKIIKEQSSSSGVRRIKAVLE